MATFDDKQQYSLNALLYDAVIGNEPERVKLCLSRGAQASAANMAAYFRARNDDPVPLAHLAFTHYHQGILDALAQAGLQIDEKDSDGDTALGRAVDRQRLECVTHFLALGASPLAENNAGKTVLDLARENNGFSGQDKRDAIIDALLTAVPLPGAFNDVAKKSDAVTTAENITVNKPISLTPHKKDGFQL
jgi:ankyrin repeat protein